MSDQKVTPGRIVHYVLSAADVQFIEALRQQRGPRLGLGGSLVNAGQIFPMIVTRVYANEVASGQVFLDGNDNLWVVKAAQGNDPGRWSWPPRV